VALQRVAEDYTDVARHNVLDGVVGETGDVRPVESKA
jgi:formate dehydrogenase assembly factor FdhD